MHGITVIVTIVKNKTYNYIMYCIFLVVLKRQLDVERNDVFLSEPIKNIKNIYVCLYKAQTVYKNYYKRTKKLKCFYFGIKNHNFSSSLD